MEVRRTRLALTPSPAWPTVHLLLREVLTRAGLEGAAGSSPATVPLASRGYAGLRPDVVSEFRWWAARDANPEPADQKTRRDGAPCPLPAISPPAAGTCRAYANIGPHHFASRLMSRLAPCRSRGRNWRSETDSVLQPAPPVAPHVGHIPSRPDEDRVRLDGSGRTPSHQECEIMPRPRGHRTEIRGDEIEVLPPRGDL
jgi:hypothetical protein